jgi:hypothetical protein
MQRNYAMARPIPDLRECKTEAKRLLANLLSNDSPTAREAADRFARAGCPPTRDADEILEQRDEMQLKNAQAVIARERKFADWKALKDAADVLWYPHGAGAFLNHWFAHYDQARAHLDQCGGYLLTHRGDFFVCESAFIRFCGLDPADPRWELTGHDIARPRDKHAGEELIAARERAAKAAAS